MWEKFTNAARLRKMSTLWNVENSVMCVRPLSNQESLTLYLHCTETDILTCEVELGSCFKLGPRSSEEAHECPPKCIGMNTIQDEFLLVIPLARVLGV